MKITKEYMETLITGVWYSSPGYFRVFQKWTGKFSQKIGVQNINFGKHVRSFPEAIIYVVLVSNQDAEWGTQTNMNKDVLIGAIPMYTFQ